MMRPVSYEAPAKRVVFGRGTPAQVGNEICRLGRARGPVLSPLPQAAGARRLAVMPGWLAAAGVFAGAVMHALVPVKGRAVEEAAAAGADRVVSLGGGSTTGPGKAVALRIVLSQFVVPTTDAGSEATPIPGRTENRRKATLRDHAEFPEVVAYDVDLTLGPPTALSAPSGLDAVAHAVWATYVFNGNPVTVTLANQGIAASACALQRIVADPADAAARGDAVFGTWACGTCLGTVGMGLHHKLCHVLGGTFDLPHAEIHALGLPHAVAYNAAAAPEAMGAIARALSVPHAARGVYDFGCSLGLSRGLRAIGMPEAGMDEAAAQQAVATPYPNPGPLDRGAIRAALQAAWNSGPPVPIPEEAAHA